jgi:uncharacterized protein YjbJ (UPF0337 family)
MDKDRIVGAGKQAVGAVKETVGKMTGDKKTEAEGTAQKTEGKVQNTVGGVKETELRDPPERASWSRYVVLGEALEGLHHRPEGVCAAADIRMCRFRSVVISPSQFSSRARHPIEAECYEVRVPGYGRTAQPKRARDQQRPGVVHRPRRQGEKLGVQAGQEDVGVEHGTWSTPGNSFGMPAVQFMTI